MIITRNALQRRSFLRGMGTVLALPLLDAMIPTMGSRSWAATRAPVRMGFVYVPNGIMNLKGEWLPPITGTDLVMGPTMKPLEPFRNQLTVFNGLAQVGGRALGDGPGDHARAGATWLTGVHPKKTDGADIHVGPSADQLAARELGKETQFASLELGLEGSGVAGGCDSGYSCAYTNTISWKTASNPLPVEFNPRAVFERLFGDGESNDPKSRAARMNEERSILDYVGEDVSRMSKTLGAKDRNKLGEYLDSIRDIERRIQMAEQKNKEVAMPTLDKPAGVPAEFEDHAHLMIDLQILAFQADLTRVSTLMFAHEESNRSYRSIGIPDGHHSVTHHQYDPEKIAKTTRINELHVKTFAYYLDRMRSTPDGDGSLLDHSMVLYGSSIDDGNIHTHDTLPLVLVGSANGKVKGNRLMVYPKDTPMNNMLLGMMDAAGVRVEKFGDSTGELPNFTGLS